jgi:RNA polymerase sigma-70 factor, ECF subfamily
MSARAEEVFTTERPRLLGLAYRILGSLGDAEDVVQDAWLAWLAEDRGSVDRPSAFLTTMVTRMAIDRVRLIQRRREHYVGPWLPEPVAIDRGPQEQVELAESLTLGFLIVLDRLSPIERAVWLLADVFGEPFSVIAGAVDKSQIACRKIASRARQKMELERPPPSGHLDVHLLSSLLSAVSRGDHGRILTLLYTDVVLISDGGPDRRAARRPVVGATRVARFLTNLASRNGQLDAMISEFNGAAAVILHSEDGPVIITGEQHNGQVTQVFMILNPDKMHTLSEHPARMD